MELNKLVMIKLGDFEWELPLKALLEKKSNKIPGSIFMIITMVSSDLLWLS